MPHIPNDQRFLVIPVFTFEDHEEGKFKQIRVRADEITGYYKHDHELSYGEDHVYMINGITIQFKSFEAQCSPLTVQEMDAFFWDEYFLESYLSGDQDCKGQEIVYAKIREIKEQRPKAQESVPTDYAELPDVELPGMWERADFIDNSEEDDS